jgi:mannosyltransferase
MKTDRSITPSEKLLAARLGRATLRSVARRHVLAVHCALFFGAALLIRLYRLGSQSLWLDEGGTWAEVTGKGWPALLAELWGRDAAYPLYHILLKGWVGLAGDSEWALRLPSALGGAAAVVAIYLAAAEIGPPTTDHRPPTLQNQEPRTQNRRTTNNNTRRVLPFTLYLLPFTSYPLIAALLFAVSPFALWYAQDAKVYSLLMLVVALELWALLRALRRGGRGWLLVLAAMIVSIFVHRLALLAAAGSALTYLIIWPTASLLEPRTTQRVPDQEPRTITTEHASRTTHHASHIMFHPARIAFALLTAVIAGAGAAGMAAGFSRESRGVGGHIPAGPLQGLWLSFAHFSADRGDLGGFLGLPLVVWMLPCIILTLWGLALLLRDAVRCDVAAIAILCLLVVPLALLAAALAVTPVYEARYATIAFPAWVMALAYPFLRSTTDDRRPTTDDRPFAPTQGRRPLRLRGSRASRGAGQATTEGKRPRRDRPTGVGGMQHVTRNTQYASRFSILNRPEGTRFSILGPLVLVALLLVNAVVLFQPKHGLFSGAPVKEQWRQAIEDVAHQVQPDDLVILHPYYVKALWEYYVPRVTPDPLPQPMIFPNFAEGYYTDKVPPAQQYDALRRDYELAYRNATYGKKRALLLIAPEHARTVDPPKPGDDYGLVGLRFQYSKDQQTWPCGAAKFVGVELMCQSYPEFFSVAGVQSIPQPAIRLAATFGGELRLRGYSLELLGGAARPGGELPVTLYWEAAAPPTRDYTMFLHLCRDCAAPPLAQDDRPPLSGYPPAGRTAQWLVGDPVHDERAVALPADLPPGRYTLLLGVYPAGDPSESARLPVASDAHVLGGTRLVLGEVEIGD